MESVDIIIVNYNSTDYLLKCLESVHVRLDGRKADVYIQDNGSLDNVKRVRSRHPHVHLTENRRNLGFSAAVNQALRVSRSPRIVLLNPDSLIGDFFLIRLLITWGAIRVRALWARASLMRTGAVQGSARSFPTPLTGIFGRTSLLSKWFPNNPVTRRNVLTTGIDSLDPVEVDWVSGACMILRRRAVEQVGFMDERSPCGEEQAVRPTSNYGRSKAEAEKRLMRMSAKTDFGGRMDILRLAPVYDRFRRSNLERRILLPGRIGCIRFGAGAQRLSILARPNLAAFVRHLIADRERRGFAVTNVCDRRPVRFIDLIRIFRETRTYPFRPVVPVPKGAARLACAISGRMICSRREWFEAAGDKLAGDLVFDNTRMQAEGFDPQHDVYSLFRERDIPAEAESGTNAWGASAILRRRGDKEQSA